MDALECPVCLEPCAKMTVTCQNGHTCCEKHHLQRAKARIEEGYNAYNDDETHCETCVLCRVRIHPVCYSDTYHKNKLLLLGLTYAKKGQCSTEKAMEWIEAKQPYYRELAKQRLMLKMHLILHAKAEYML